MKSFRSHYMKQEIHIQFTGGNKKQTLKKKSNQKI